MRVDKRELKKRFYAELVGKGRERFAEDLWARKMVRYKTRPREFALKVLGSRWWDAQDEVGTALAMGRRVAVRSGNGVGKTYLAADLALWFLYTHMPAVVITTAPTLRQVKNILWREIHSRLRTATMRLPGRFYQTRIHAGGSSFAIGFAADRGVQFQGFHCPNLLIVMDEASGIPDEIWDAAEGVAVGGNNKILAIGNPLLTSGRFYKIFKGRGWRKITISALEHPNVVSRGTRIPGCVTAEFVEGKVEEWCVGVGCEVSGVGEGQNLLTAEHSEGTQRGIVGVLTPNTQHPTPKIDVPTPNTQDPTPDLLKWRGKTYRPNDLFRARIMGEFPRSDESSLIPLAWIEAAMERELPAAGMKMAAVDVAHFGGDSTVIGLRVGFVARIVQVIEGSSLMDVVAAIVKLAYDEHPTNIAVDAIGEGAGVLDRLYELGIDGVQAVKGSERAHNPDVFANRRAEMYWGLRERFRRGEIALPGNGWVYGCTGVDETGSPTHPTNHTQQLELLSEELAAIRYRINSRGQIQIESKEVLKNRMGRSPDRADMLAMLFDGAGPAVIEKAREAEIGPSRMARLREEMRGW